MAEAPKWLRIIQICSTMLVLSTWNKVNIEDARKAYKKSYFEIQS